MAARPFLSLMLPAWLSEHEAQLMQEISNNEEGTSLQSLRERNFKPIIDSIGDSSIVMLGEATHGTEEFYRIRADLTKALIEQAHFDAVVFEGDVPSFSKLDRYVNDKNIPSDSMALQDTFATFQRFPQWMWKNAAFVNFVSWVKRHNEQITNETQYTTHLFGIDIFGLPQSIEQVLEFLNQESDEAIARDVAVRYNKIQSYGLNLREYGNDVAASVEDSQEEQVRGVLRILEKQQKNAMNEATSWTAIQNAKAVVDGESYFRHLGEGRDMNFLWNIREAAMFRNLNCIRARIATRNRAKPAKLVVWAHNSHIGGDGKRWASFGHMCREKFGNQIFTVGLTCNKGNVRAVPTWEDNKNQMEGQVMKLAPAFELSHEYLLGQLASSRARTVGYCFRNQSAPAKIDSKACALFSFPRRQRFIGVDYRPNDSKELQRHYAITRLAEEYDYVIHFDRSTAVKINGRY